MRFVVRLEASAQKALRKIPAGDVARIVTKLRSLEENPTPAGAEKLKGGSGELRVRVGDYRIIYEVHDGILVVVVVTIDHRCEVYR